MDIYLIRKSRNSKKNEISHKIGRRQKKHENPLGNRIPTMWDRSEKEAEFVHGQRKKRARKNPKLKYANLMPNQHLSPPPPILPNSLFMYAFPSPPCHQNQVPDHFEATSDKGQNASNLKRKYHNGQKITKYHQEIS
jgi:hypothetical protein